MGLYDVVDDGEPKSELTFACILSRSISAKKALTTAFEGIGRETRTVIPRRCSAQSIMIECQLHACPAAEPLYKSTCLQ